MVLGRWRLILLAKSFVICFCASSALQAELLACLAGLKRALASRYLDLLVYTDSVDLVRISRHQIPIPVSVL